MLVPRSVPKRRLTATVIAAAIAASTLSACGPDPDKTEAEQAQQVIGGIEGPVDRLQDALEQARPRSRTSMVELRAAAERAAERLDDGANDLHTLNAASATPDDRVLSDAEDALDSQAKLATALTARVPSATRIEDAGAEARLAVDDLEALRIPELNADSFVAAVRRDRRRRTADPVTRGKPGTSPPDAVGGSTFNTGRDPGEGTAAAYCRAVPGELRCWTPNDGFTLVLDEGGTRRDRASEAGNRGYEPPTPPLTAGDQWSGYGFSCAPTGRALTCQNRSGRGFTLPRYRGLPSYF